MSRTPKTLNVTEQHQLLDALLSRNAPHKSFRKGIRNYLIALLMLDAGLRVGEVVALEMSDLFFCGKPVGSLVLRPAITKNHKERSVPVSSRLSAAIAEYVTEHEYLLDEPADFPAFSVWPRSKPLTTRQVERIIMSAAAKVLHRAVHPHVLRHTFASKLMRLTDIRTVQELLGHANLASTQIYTHPNEEDKKKAIEELNKQLSGLSRDLEGLPSIDY